ncbi:hypothetical protein HMI46_25075 [Paenibacillus alvei]|uniref:Uncharacterized protein n=1 Tax=Paenibacillus alvei TaxID=44250 RepID=A0AAP7A3Y5_PAEAL|nr:hypothetical protein [Paenibacillus alvei]
MELWNYISIEAILIAADQLLIYEEQMIENIAYPLTTPFTRARLAYYYRIKGQLSICKSTFNMLAGKLVGKE